MNHSYPVAAFSTVSKTVKRKADLVQHETGPGLIPEKGLESDGTKAPVEGEASDTNEEDSSDSDEDR